MTEFKSVEIERTFAAPIATIWQMWTEAEHFASWYGPMGASIPTCEMNVEIGGRRHLCMEMETPNGPMQMWFVGEYTEISPMTRLVYTESMSNEAGDVLSPADMGMPGDGPSITEVVVELTEAGDQTHMTMHHIGIPHDSPGGMGWNMALDKLEALLAA
ncbi:MAG: SRPBCC domain-containing protein [Actinomycetota bacterium]